MATSYNGWTASPSPSAIDIDTNWTVLGSRPFGSGGFPGGVKSGPVSAVFKELVRRLHTEVEPMMSDPNGGQIGYGCWGYSYRANVNNPSVLSCHASGTAIDYNAPRHPNGTSVGANGGGGWSAEQARKIRGILADLGDVVRWLSGNDPMHFEIVGSEAEVARVAASLRTPANPTPNPPAPSRPAPAPTAPTPTTPTAPTSSEDDEMALDVVRCGDTGNDIDYAFNAATGVFFMIRDPDHYHFLRSAGIITVDHGTARRVASNLLEFIRSECARAAGVNAEKARVEGYAGKG